jgi:hypothetical protein
LRGRNDTSDTSCRALKLYETYRKNVTFVMAILLYSIKKQNCGFIFLFYGKKLIIAGML